MVIGSIDVNVPKGNSICCGGTLSEGAWDYNDSTFLYTEKNGYEQEIATGNGEHIRGYYLPAGEYELELVEAPSILVAILSMHHVCGDYAPF